MYGERCVHCGWVSPSQKDMVVHNGLLEVAVDDYTNVLDFHGVVEAMEGVGVE